MIKSKYKVINIGTLEYLLSVMAITFLFSIDIMFDNDLSNKYKLIIISIGVIPWAMGLAIIPQVIYQIVCNMFFRKSNIKGKIL